jgi:hypothetical protein
MGYPYNLTAANDSLVKQLLSANAELLMTKASLKLATARAEEAEERIKYLLPSNPLPSNPMKDVSQSQSHTSWGSSPAELQWLKRKPNSSVGPSVGPSVGSEPEPQPRPSVLKFIEPVPQADGHSEHSGLFDAIRDVTRLDKDVAMYTEYVAKNYKTGPYHSFENWKRFVSDDRSETGVLTRSATKEITKEIPPGA